MIQFLNTKYYIDRFGNVFSKGKKNIKRLKSSKSRWGYLFVTLCTGGVAKVYHVHKLVALIWAPNPMCKPQINHIDGCKLNNHVTNLEWVTRSENMRHASINNLLRIKKGSKSHFAKLKESNVIEIRKLWLTGNYKQNELAKTFGVSKVTIHEIVMFKTWASICA